MFLLAMTVVGMWTKIMANHNQTILSA